MYITRNALIPMKYDELGLSIVLCAVLFLFPEIFNKNKTQVFLGIIIILPLLGTFFYTIDFLLESLLIILFLISIIFNLKKWKSVSFHFVILSFLVSLFLILLIYSSSAQILSPVYNELIINGKAVPDTLFHSAVSTSIINEKIVSTRIFGSAVFPYHWFSHFVFAGLAKFIHVNNIAFYNWIYPVTIIPIFIKYLFVLYQEIFKYFNTIKEKYLLIFFPCLLLYFFIILGIGGFPSYLSSESLMLAHVFQFIFWFFILKYQSKISENKTMLLLVFFLIIMLLFTKVSVGLLTFIPAAYLFLRTMKNKTDFFILVICSLIFVGICYFYFLNIRVEHESVGFITRLLNFNGSVISFYSYFASILFLLTYFVSEKNSIIKIKSDFRQKTKIFEELVAISIIFSLVMGIYFGSRKDDSLYFASTYFFINFIIIVLFFVQNIKLSTNSNRLKWIGFSIIIFSFIMTPQFFMIKHNSFNEKRMALQKDKKMAKLLTFLSEEKLPENTVISISRNEKWFWDSQRNKITPYFIVSGVGNSPALIEISDKDLKSNHYSFPSYKNTYSNISTNNLLQQKALSMGYNNLIYFETLNNELVVKKIKLKE